MRLRFWIALCGLLAVFAVPSILLAQTTLTGAVTGTVTDPSGAAVPEANITLKSLSTSSTQATKTNGTGLYSFPFVQPGDYTLNVTASGFQAQAKRVTVSLGANTPANLQLALASTQTTVEVRGESAAPVETEDANVNTTFNSRAVEMLPNPGNDLSAVALTAPGVVMNTAGGAQFGGGNYEVFGLPATSNLFTYDGANDNDPYFNVNNSGATNLTLGLNDVQETAVVVNGYSGAYGGLAGANINFISKSGSNQFHGNAEYWWNGRVMNANNYFRNQSGATRPFVNANQFAGSLGGPIKKDKAFFFFDYEGIYLVIPSPVSINLPTPQFANAVLANVGNDPLYQQGFRLFGGVSQAGAQALPAGTNGGAGGCANIVPTGNFAAFATTPCAVKVQGGFSAHTHDVLYVGRYDQNIGNNDKLFVRVEHEHGLQASFTDPISSAFNAISDQPQWQSQTNWTHTFGTDKVNNFAASLLWYSATFTFQNPSAEASPTTGFPAMLQFSDGSLTTLNGLGAIFPQGRNITQYQFVDDYSWVHGRHNFKVGVNFHRDDISDQNFTFTTPLILATTLADFAAGGFAGLPNDPGSVIIQNFPTRREVPIALYQLGAYAADDLKVSPNLKLTLSLRLDHLSNPVCQINCFQRLAAPWPQLNHSASVPVNQAILTGRHTAFPSVTSVVAQPKIGFAWSPWGRRDTVLRGGVGIFSDALPTGAIDSFLQSAPLDPQFISAAAPLSQTVPGNLFALEQAANSSFVTNFASGGTVAPFGFYNATAVKVPRYYEWSLELQQAVGWRTTLSTMYVGNHGTHEEISDGADNAFFPVPFANLPTTIPDSRFGQVSHQANIANSNYAGLVLTARHQAAGGFQFQASYTFSHALDEISNNSLSPFGLNNSNNIDVIFPQDPHNIRKYNYGNASYDIRHSFNMSYVWNDAFRHLTSRGPNALLKGWTFSGTIFRHSGLPTTVFSSADTSALLGNNYGAGAQSVFANVIGPTRLTCSGAAAKLNNPCWQSSNFADPFNPATYTGIPLANWGQTRRDQFRGPGYFNTDFGAEKAFRLWEGGQISIGARFFNLFNHPDFAFPVANIDSPQFGQILQTVSSPTSIYGSGLGADASPRLIQWQAKLTF